MGAVCAKKCYFRKRLWKPGEPLELKPGEPLPKHFIEKEKYKAPGKPKEPDEPKTLSEIIEKNKKDFGDFLG